MARRQKASGSGQEDGLAQKKNRRRVQRKAKRPERMADGCTIPSRVPDAAMNQFTLGRNENEANRITEYVECQCSKELERVTYLEKVQTEHLFGTRYDCWNVRTDKERYWVITSPTNLYLQELFPSLDYTLSFHIGLMARVQARRKGAEDDRLGDRLAAAFRRWEQAAESLDRSEESEEVQAAGLGGPRGLVAILRTGAAGDIAG